MMISLDTLGLHEVAVLGAHCDDVAIGLGGTLLTLASSTPGLRVRALVLAGADARREIEERHALAALCPDADLELTVLDVPDGYAPAYWEPIKKQSRPSGAIAIPTWCSLRTEPMHTRTTECWRSWFRRCSVTI